MKVTLASKGRSGRIKKTVKVETNDETSPQTVLIVRADVKVLLGLRPDRLHLGEIVEGQVVEKSLELVGEEAAGVKLLSVDGGSHFDVALRQDAEDAGKTVFRLLFSAKSPLQRSPIRQQIDVETSHPKMKHLHLTVTARPPRQPRGE